MAIMQLHLKLDTDIGEGIKVSPKQMLQRLQISLAIHEILVSTIHGKIKSKVKPKQ